jgi:hypothetical protein
MSTATTLSTVVNEDITIWFSVETFRNVSSYAISFAVIKRTGLYYSAERSYLSVDGRAQIKIVYDSSLSRYL